ncbi:glycosyl hydrolase-related protein [Lentzea kentuckyensis]|uniref:glycosyl hydrolase-related protein n=1 Tax=Lentzea kentuckyensis TaxID=360086 RepID=UPI0013020F2A
MEAVLLAHDGSGDLVVRVYEALGNRVEAVVRAADAVRGWQRTDLLERGSAAWEDGGEARLSLRPFELCTVRFRSAGVAPA